MDRTVHSQSYTTDYNNNESLFDSHYTRVTQPQEQEDNWFIEQRAYSRSVLAGWGLPLGELPYSADNQQTLRCIVELISFRQKDLAFRAKVKEDISAVNFQKDKYRSFMQQAQRSLEECMRKLGRSQNQLSDFRNKNKRGQVQAKKEREEDRKMIAMLRAKNEQIMHEIKKKQQDVNRVKEQMKKSVGEKSLVQAKNSIELFEALSPLKRQSSQKAEQAKYGFLMERNEKQMAHLVKQNGILRDKLFQLRQHLIDFHEWIDTQLFGEKDADSFKRKTRFPLNHNLVFKKESLVDELSVMVETAKDGIIQLRDFYRGGQPVPQKKARSSQLLPSTFEMEDLKFKKKKSVKPQMLKTDRSKPDIKQMPMIEKVENTFTQNYSPRTKKNAPVPRQTPTPAAKANRGLKVFGTDKSRKSSVSSARMEEMQLPFEDELMSDMIESQDNDNSLVSHIEVSKIGKNKFDKWDILYQDDD